MSGPGSGKGDDAIDVLKHDHDEAERMFKASDEARDAGDPERKAAVATRVCHALAVHARIEEELFYPALRAADEDAAILLNEAAVEHATVKNLVDALEGNAPDDPLYDATMHVLAEYVKHHVREEEGEIFPLAREAGLDLAALGAAMLERRHEVDAAATDRRRGNGRASTRHAPAGERAGTRKPAQDRH
jgi:hemerythrin superfamily protein